MICIAVQGQGSIEMVPALIVMMIDIEAKLFSTFSRHDHNW